MAKKPRGVYTDAGLTDKVADFSYQNDALAQMIVDAWTNAAFYNSLIDPPTATRVSNAKAALEARGIYLMHPIVLKEEEYENGWPLHDANGVIFVLPKRTRATAGKPLLETAKLLMACTPNGI